MSKKENSRLIVDIMIRLITKLDKLVTAVIDKAHLQATELLLNNRDCYL